MKLFGIEVVKPIERSNVVEVASMLPVRVKEKIDSEGMTFEQAKEALNYELNAFLEALDPHDAELFCDFLEEETSLLADEADEDEDEDETLRNRCNDCEIDATGEARYETTDLLWKLVV